MPAKPSSAACRIVGIGKNSSASHLAANGANCAAAKSRAVYEWVSKLCHGLGAEDEDLVPFEKYAKAAEGLGKPSSAARALFGGAEHIERVDCLVRRIAKQQGLQSDTLDEIVTLVDERLGRNRAVALSR